MIKKTNPDIKNTLTGLEKLLDEYLVKKAPSLPKQVKEIIVNYGPYLIILSLVFAVPSVLALLGIGTLGLPFRFFSGLKFGFSYTLSTLVMLATLVLEAIALPSLLKKSSSGWKLMYYSALISALHSLLLLNIGSFLIGTVLSLYVLFQIKSYYK